MEVLLVVTMALFAVTHIDTFVVLVAFSTNPRYRVREILLGHYLGFTIGLILAIIATVVAPNVVQDSAFLLGFVPLAIGMWGLRRRVPEMRETISEMPSSTPKRIAIVTSAGVGLSGENIAVFVPFFLTLSSTELGRVVGVYLVAAGVVFGLALFVGRRVASVQTPEWIERRLVPAVLVAVGLYVIVVGWMAA